MKETWLSVLEWIQLAFTLLFIVCLGLVLVLVVLHYRLEFNGLWKTRVCMVWLAVLWALGLLLGRHQLWQPGDGALAVSAARFKGLCKAHVFLTFGVWQPLFFLVILMILRSKEKAKLQLYADDPNKFILYRAALWCIPIVLAHIVILALGAVTESNPIVWSTYNPEHQHCVVPILSTATVAGFYCFFLVFYMISSSKLFTRLINRRLRARVRWTQLFFVLVFPLELALRFIDIFLADYHDAFEAVYHTYYFLELIVCTVAIIEFVLRPVLDAASFPLLVGVTATACQEYNKSEEERKQRRYTKTHTALQRVKSSDEMDQSPLHKPSPLKIEMDPLPLPKPSSSHSHSHSHSPSHSPPSSGDSTPAIQKPLLSSPVLTSSSQVPRSGFESEDGFDNIADLSVTLTATGGASGYPADLEDIFANLDDEADPDDSSLKLKVEGVFLRDPEL